MKGFLNPPDSAKPRAYWWWLDSNTSKAGITRDLEEMKRQGIAGVLIFDAGEGKGSPVGPPFMGPEWRERLKFALVEADRLGIEVGLNLCSGWDCGGTWVEPKHASQKLVWSQIRVQGPLELSQELPQPETIDNYYQDIAIVAFQETGSSSLSRMQAASVKLSAGSTYQNYSIENAIDDDIATRWISDGHKRGDGPSAERPEFIMFEFPQPFTATSLAIVPYQDCGPHRCELQSSEDGVTYTTIHPFTMAVSEPIATTFKAVQAQYFRLKITSSYTFGSTERPRNVQIAAIQLLEEGEQFVPRLPIAQWEIKSANQGLGDSPVGALCEDELSLPGDCDFESDSTIDLTGKCDRNGRLVWTVPEGKWSIFRFGYTLLGAKTKCTSPGAQGYEIDFLSTEAMDMHFAAMAEKVIDDIGPLAGETLKYFHDDSWEVGNPTWTPKFRSEFEKRRGYDLFLYFPVLTGRIVDSREISNRFLWDYRRTIADCIAENHYGRLSALSSRYGIGTHPESGGPFFPHIDALLNLGRNDIPMGEFWARQSEPDGPIFWTDHYALCDTIKQAASAAHIYGKKLSQAEAFTTMGPNWEEDPFMLKDVGDRAFCQGLTRNVLCFYVHQPELDRLPGYQWEAAGTHFDRNITWWNQSHAWLAYLARCQYLLQQGLFVADVCYFYGEDVPAFVPAKQKMIPALPSGYDCDTTNAEVLLSRMSVRDGRIVLPDGMSYRLLVLPERRSIGVRVLEKIAELVKAGATVVGPKPVKATGLRDYPKCDRDVNVLAEQLWGFCDGETITEHRFGKGRVIWGKTLKEILTADGINPDFEYSSVKPDAELDYIHQSTGNEEIYFISNQKNRYEEVQCTFRVNGKSSELWIPDTGQRRKQVLYQVTSDGRTTLPLALPPRGSIFVIFRTPSMTDTPVVSLVRNNQALFPGTAREIGEFSAVDVLPGEDGKIDLQVWHPGVYELTDSESKTARIHVESLPEPLELTGPWEIRFPVGWGAPPSMVFEKLISWTEHDDPGVKYFSGTALYRKQFQVPDSFLQKKRRLALDLGALSNLADLTLNGESLGVLWKPPFRMDVTNIVKPGTNLLEVAVTNLWPNRLIGDRFLPEGKRFTHTNVTKFTKESPLLRSGLFGPVQIHAAEQISVHLEL